jgi:hypothetical protein
MGVAQNHPKLDHLNVESHGFGDAMGSTILGNPHMNDAYDTNIWYMIHDSMIITLW